MNLNPGGIIGAILGAGIVVAFVVMGDGEMRRVGKAVAGAAAIGGFLGNFLWNLAFPGATLTDGDADGTNDYTGEPVGNSDDDFSDVSGDD